MEKKSEYLDSFERILEEGLVKICTQVGLLDGRTMLSPDITDKWNDEYLKDYVADAVTQFNGYPEAAMAWAGYLGMAVAHDWDRDWEACHSKPYSEYYGPRGWDDMDDHITDDLLGLPEDRKDRVRQTFQSCAAATLGLLRHEGIETCTEDGFFILVRIYTVFFAIGASMELKRLGYKMQSVQTDKAYQS